MIEFDPQNPTRPETINLLLDEVRGTKEPVQGFLRFLLTSPGPVKIPPDKPLIVWGSREQAATSVWAYLARWRWQLSTKTIAEKLGASPDAAYKRLDKVRDGLLLTFVGGTTGRYKLAAYLLMRKEGWELEEICVVLRTNVEHIRKWTKNIDVPGPGAHGTANDVLRELLPQEQGR
jgi:hypothetical protein